MFQLCICSTYALAQSMDHYSEWLTASYTDPVSQWSTPAEFNCCCIASCGWRGEGVDVEVGVGVTQLALKCLPRPGPRQQQWTLTPILHSGHGMLTYHWPRLRKVWNMCVIHKTTDTSESWGTELGWTFYVTNIFCIFWLLYLLDSTS